MDDQQAGRVNEAAQQFAGALMESFRAVSGRTVLTQQLNAELTQNFFNTVIENLRTEAERNRELTQELAGQQQRQWEAAQELTQESTSAYMDFLNSMFFYYRGSVEEAERSTREAERGAEEAERGTREYISDLIRETNRRSRGEA
jgi:hypothetical protein